MKQNTRGSDVFLKADIAAILRALALTIEAATPGDYTRGYRAALAAAAVALNIDSDNSPAAWSGSNDKRSYTREE